MNLFINRFEWVFQFTTSQGGRLVPHSLRQVRHSPFNSRPHKEVDGKLAIVMISM